MPYDYPYYSSATLGRKGTPSSSHWSSTISSNRSYGSSGYSGLDSNTTYSPSSLSSMSLYLPPRTPSVPSSPSLSQRHIRQTSQYVSSKQAPMSSAMTKRDSLIRTLVRNSHDLESHHFLSNDSVSMITGTNYYQSSSRRVLPSQTTSKSNKFSRSYTTDLSNVSVLASSSNSYRTSSPIYTVPERAYRDPYRPIVIPRPSFSSYVPPPKEERSKALPRTIRRDRPLIKFLEKEDVNPAKVHQALDALSKGENPDEEGTGEDDDGNKKRDSVRSNDSGIGSYRNSFLRRSRQKSGDVSTDLNQITLDNNKSVVEENESHASLFPKAHTPSVDEGVHLDTDDGFRTPTPITSPLGFRDDTVDSGDENKLQSSTSVGANDDNLPDNNTIETTRTKRRVRICSDKYVDPLNEKDETTNKNDTENSRNLNDRRGSSGKRVRSAILDSKINSFPDSAEIKSDAGDVSTKRLSKSTSDRIATRNDRQRADTSNNISEISDKTKANSNIIANTLLVEKKTLQTDELKPTSDGVLVQEKTKCAPQTDLIRECDKNIEQKPDDTQIKKAAENCEESALMGTEILPADTEAKKKKKVKKLLDGENKKTKIKKATSSENDTKSPVTEKEPLREEKLPLEVNKTDLSNHLKTKIVATDTIPLKVDQPKDTAKIGLSVTHENNKEKYINNKTPSIPAIESNNTRLSDKCEQSALVKMKKDQPLSEKDGSVSKADEPILTGKTSMHASSLQTQNRSEGLKIKDKLARNETLVNHEKNLEELNKNALNHKVIPSKNKTIVEDKPLSTDKTTTASTNAAEKVNQSKDDDMSQSTPKLKKTKIFGDTTKSHTEQEKISLKPVTPKIKEDALEQNKDNQKSMLVKKKTEASKEEIKTNANMIKDSIAVKSELSSVRAKVITNKSEKTEFSNANNLSQPVAKIQTLTKDDQKTMSKVKIEEVETKVLPMVKTESDIIAEPKGKKENIEVGKPTEIASNDKSTSLTHIKNIASESKIEKITTREKKLCDEKFQKVETKLKINIPSSMTSDTKTSSCKTLKEPKFSELKSPIPIPEKPKKLISAEKDEKTEETKERITTSVSTPHASTENIETKVPLSETSAPSDKLPKNKRDEIKGVEKSITKKKATDDSLSILNENISKSESSDAKPNKQVSNEVLESGTDNIPDVKPSDTDMKSRVSAIELYKKTLNQKCKPLTTKTKNIEQSVEEKKTTNCERKEINYVPKRKISDAVLKTSEIFMAKNKDIALRDKATNENISADESRTLKVAKGKVCEAIKLKTIITKQDTTKKVELKEVPQSNKEETSLDKNESNYIPPKTEQPTENCRIKLQKSASADSSPDSQNTQKNGDKDVSKLRRSSALDGVKHLGMKPNFDIKKIIAESKSKPLINTSTIQHETDKVISNTETEMKTSPINQKTIKRSTTEDLSTMSEHVILLQKSQSTGGNGLVKKLPIHNLTTVIKPQLQPKTKTICSEEKVLKSDLQTESTRKVGKIQRSTTTDIVALTSDQKPNVLQKSSSAGCNNFQNIFDTQVTVPPSRLQKPPIPFPRTAKTKNTQAKSKDSKEPDTVCKNDIPASIEINDEKKDETKLKEKTDSVGCVSTTDSKDSDLKNEAQLKISEKEPIIKLDRLIEQTEKTIEKSSQNLEEIISSESRSDIKLKQSSVIKSAKISGKENKIIEETEKVTKRAQENSTITKAIQNLDSAVATKQVQETIPKNDLSITSVETQVIQPSETSNIQPLQNTEALPLTENKLNIDGKVSTVKVKKEKKAKHTHEDGEKPKKKKKKKVPVPPISTDIITNEPLTVINEKTEDKRISTSNLVENQKTKEEGAKPRQGHDNVAGTKNIEDISATTDIPGYQTDEQLQTVWGAYCQIYNEEMPGAPTSYLDSFANDIENLNFRERHDIKNFNFLKVLGRGSFGKVMLAELKGRNEYFAVKCLKKDVVLADKDVECTMIEKEVLAMGSNHPYLCTLYLTFQSKSHLFFVMEYLSGGDLMFHIQQSGKFNEDRARFYSAEIVSALRYLHRHGIIYRDAKLDNICIDADGHVRLVDFGFCKIRIPRKESLPKNICGTPDYMAPEIIKGHHYCQSVDWWSFGVLLFEMLVGESPFSGMDEEELFWSVCNQEAHIPVYVSLEATHILELLLDKEPETRLGMPGCINGDILTQPFFHGIDWCKVEKKELEPPFKPRVVSKTDVSNFDSDFTTEFAALSPTDEEVIKTLDQAPFTGFTFTNPMIYK